MFLWDSYDETSPREQDALRALKSALLGVLLFPLQLYTAWLILLVLLADQPLRERYFWYVVVAAALFGAHLLFITALVWLMSHY